MDLLTPDQRGVLTGDVGVHIEFDSDETIDRFSTAWWSEVHAAVDVSNAQGEFKITYSGGQAIVTGLMGIDWVHTPGAELHPVWALAIQTAAGWAFFVRNWGNEGLCSSQQHYLEDLPGGTYTFKLPWESSFGARGQKIPATDVSILPAEIRTNIPFPQNLVSIYKILGQGVVVTFKLPPAAQGGEPFYEGEIHLAWQFPPDTSTPRPTPLPHDPKCDKVPPPPSCEPDSPERLLGSKLSDSQKATMIAKLKQSRRVGATTLLGQNAIHIDRLDHLPSPPTSGPTTRAIFDEKKAGRDKLRQDQLTQAFHGAMPHFPEARPSPSPHQ